MSPEYVVLPDMNDSDGHCGPGIQRFPLLPIPPPGLSFPVTRWGDIVSAEVRQSLSYSNSLTHSLIHSFPLITNSLLGFHVHFLPFFMHHLFLLILSASFHSLWFFVIMSFSLLICSPTPLPFHTFLSSYSFLLSLFWCSFFIPWNGSSGVVGTKIEQVVNSCLVS